MYTHVAYLAASTGLPLSKWAAKPFLTSSSCLKSGWGGVTHVAHILTFNTANPYHQYRQEMCAHIGEYVPKSNTREQPVKLASLSVVLTPREDPHLCEAALPPAGTSSTDPTMYNPAPPPGACFVGNKPIVLE